MELTSIQNNAVNKIVEHYKNKDTNNINLVYFSAPTGSGKTFMIANVIDKILETKTDDLKDKTIFVIFTLSQAELPIQFNNKLNEYKYDLISQFTSKHYSSPSTNNTSNDNDYDIDLIGRHVYVFGASSFGKNRIYSEYGKFNSFISDAVNQGYEIIYIRDEAHIGDKKTKDSSDSEQKFVQQNASFIIKMTATPSIDEIGYVVSIKESDLTNPEINDGKYLLKTNRKLNAGIISNDIDNKTIVESDVLNSAIAQFKKLKQIYHKKSIQNNNYINPAMLIQISSKNQFGEDVKETGGYVDEIIDKLKQNNLSYVVYLSERKESSIIEGNLKTNNNGKVKNSINLKDISKNDSNVDVIIFKVGPATGWDIPRANMLVQLRRVCSDKLNQQTVGRIKRNPTPNLEYDPVYMDFYLYSDHQDKTRDVHKYVLQEQFKEVNFPSILSVTKNSFDVKQKNIEFLNTKVDSFIQENVNKIIEIKTSLFDDNPTNKIIINSTSYHSNTKTDGSIQNKNYQLVETLNNYLDVVRYKFIKTKDIKWIDLVIFKTLFDKHFKNKNINFDQFMLIILKDFLNHLTELRRGYFTHDKKYIIKENNLLPPNFVIYEGDDISVDFKSINELYGYEYVLLDKNNNKQTIQYLDSSAESKFLKYIIDLVKKHKWNNKIEILAKNPLQSKIFCEYWNEDKTEYSRGYMDFIFKLKDKNEFLFLEVKSVDDYNEIKTQSIKKSMNEYLTALQNSKIKLSLVLTVVDTKSNISDVNRFDINNKGTFVSLNNPKIQNLPVDSSLETVLTNWIDN